MGGVGSRDRLCQTSPIPRSPDGDNNYDNILSHYHENDEIHYLGAAEKEEKAALVKKHCRLREPSLVE